MSSFTINGHQAIIYPEFPNPKLLIQPVLPTFERNPQNERLMKSYLIPFALLFFGFSFFGQGQEMEVVPVEQATENGKQPGLSIQIPDADRRTIKRAWKKRMKDFENENIKSRRKYVKAEYVKIPDISEHPMNVMAKWKDNKEGIGLTVFWQIGDHYLDQGHQNYDQAEAFVRNFAVQQRRLILKEKQEEQKELLEDYQDRQEKLANEKQELNEQIEECQKIIKDAEKALKQNDKHLSEIKSTIKEQNEKVEQLEEKLDALD